MKKGSYLLVAMALGIAGVYRWSATGSTTTNFTLEVPASKQVPAAAQSSPDVPLASPRIAAEVEKRAAASSAHPSVTIQVVDGAGNPLTGVPVAIRERDAAVDEPDLDRSVTQGSEGCARFEDLPEDPRHRGVFAHLEVLGCQEIGAMIVRTDLPAEPVRLTLPPCGSVAVWVHDTQGRFLEKSRVQLAERDRGSGSAHAFIPGSRKNDRMIVDFVALGLDLRVTAQNHWQSGEASGSGPRAANERVEFEIDFGPVDLRVVGRFVDEEGRGIADCAYDCDERVKYPIGVVGGGGASAGGTRTTDADGRFRLTMPRFSGSLALRPRCAEYRESLGVLVQVDGRNPSEEIDLGDLVVRARSELASGHVVDDLGAPVSFAAIVGRTGEGAALDPNLSESAVHGDCLADGTFTVSGPRPAGQLRLRASRRGYVDAESALIVPGATDVCITMTRMGRIEGSLLLDDIGSSARLWVHATPRRQSQDPSAIPLELAQGLVDHDGTFVIPNVTPGACDLAIYIEGGQTALLTLEGLALLPGDVATDERLTAIDLRGKIPAPVPLPTKRD
ncbi:MAG: hypothetical protein ABI054_05100 [Planctomycetota bacterium]